MKEDGLSIWVLVGALVLSGCVGSSVNDAKADAPAAKVNEVNSNLIAKL